MRHMVILAALAATTLTTPREAVAADLGAMLDDLARPLIKEGHIIGMTVGVIRDDQQLIRGYGKTTKAADGATPDGDTVYEIGSISKTFTGVLLAEAVVRGELSLGDTLAQHAPKGVNVPRRGPTPITLRHLATHTSGLPRMPGNFDPADTRQPFADYTADRAWAYLAGHELQRAPEAMYEYSNYAAGLVGIILERAAGRDYETLLAERVTGPLKMTRTRVKMTSDMRAQLAQGYDPFYWPAPPWEFDALAGAGGIRSTVSDMCEYLRANLSPEDTSLHKSLILARQKHFQVAGSPAMGLFWHYSSDGRALWHNGQTGAYHSFVAFSPKEGAGVVVLSNCSTGEVDRLGNEILKALLRQ